jgi:hypothetical protein
MTWSRGEHVIWRSRPDDVVGFTFPAIVVEDSDDIIALFQPTGAICKRRSGTRGGPSGRNMVSWDGSHVDWTFDKPSTIRLHVPSSGFELIRSWTGESYEGWYINLVEPWTRTRRGFDTWDRILDVVADDDMTSWHWKDEDELAWAVDRGAITTEEAERFRAEGLRAIELMRTRRFPFDADWSRFAPDSSWPIPVLPEDWDVVS